MGIFSEIKKIKNEPPESGSSKKDLNDSLLMRILIIFYTAAVSYVGSMLYSLEEPQIIRTVVMCTLGSIVTIFSIDKLHSSSADDGWGDFSLMRFVVCFLVSFSASMLFPTMTSAVWPFLSIFVMLALFSNTVTGIVSGSVCLLFALLLHGNTDSGIFYLYFISGIFGCIIFSSITEEFKVALPIFLSELSLFVCLVANIILMKSDLLEPEMFLMPGVNILINFIFLLIILKAYSALVVHRYRDRFTDLVDPECELMKKLRECSEKEYYHSIHVAYFCDRIARKISLDETAVKAAGYYHHIGMIYGENSRENIEKAAAEYAFPPKLDEILHEYMERNTKIMSREALTLLFSEWIVSSMEYLFQKDDQGPIDYENVIRSIFTQKFSKLSMWNSTMTLRNVYDMEKVFIDEKLYYDIMRT
jgi:membrane-associated HD superfamily phosphohydrolase